MPMACNEWLKHCIFRGILRIHVESMFWIYPRIFLNVNCLTRMWFKLNHLRTPNEILSTSSELKLVERMQRLATRCVRGPSGLQHPARLRELQLSSMQSHILQSTLIAAYNLLHGNLNLPLEEFFDAPAVNHLREHQFKVRQPRFQLARRQAAFAVLVVWPWNRLPPSVAEAPSLNPFKERLKNWWASILLNM